VLVQNSKTWYVRWSGVARLFRWLIVAILGLLVSSHRAHLLFCDPKRVVLAPLHTHKEPQSSHYHFERVARGRFIVVSAHIQLRDPPLFWLVRCDACVFVLPLPVGWRRPPHSPQHHRVYKRNENAVLRVWSVGVDSVRRTVRALPGKRLVWQFAIVDILI
jgi:hypothetical protein